MNNESAFPTSFSSDYPTEITGGMSMRDYFAAKAMQAILSKYGLDRPGEAFQKSLANSAYIIADEMMKARVREYELNRT